MRQTHVLAMQTAVERQIHQCIAVEVLVDGAMQNTIVESLQLAVERAWTAAVIDEVGRDSVAWGDPDVTVAHRDRGGRAQRHGLVRARRRCRK